MRYNYEPNNDRILHNLESKIIGIIENKKSGGALDQTILVIIF